MADHGINSDPAWNWKATGALYILYRDIHICYLHTYIYIYSIHYNVSTYFWKALPPAQQKKLKTTVLQVGRAPHKALAFFSRVGASSLGGCMEWQCYNAIFICIIKLSITKTIYIYICYKLYIYMWFLYVYWLNTSMTFVDDTLPQLQDCPKTGIVSLSWENPLQLVNGFPSIGCPSNEAKSQISQCHVPMLRKHSILTSVHQIICKKSLLQSGTQTWQWKIHYL